MKTGKSFILIVAIALLKGTVCLCDTHYVWKGGSYTFPYTSPQTAATSIQAAVDAADPGDTVFVTAGEYTESIVLNKEGINLVGENALTTRLTYPPQANRPDYIILGKVYPLVRRFTIVPSPRAGDCGIKLSPGSSGTVGDCIFVASENDYSVAISCESFSGRVVNCLIVDFDAGISCEDSDATILNCTICCNGSGVSCGFSKTFPTIVNSILWYNYEQIYHYWEGGPKVLYSDVQNGTSGLSNISAEPRFVNWQKRNLRLSEDSPCIDAGDGQFPDLPETDLDSTPRLLGANVDMGAYEYVSTQLAIDTDSLPTGALGPNMCCRFVRPAVRCRIAGLEKVFRKGFRLKGKERLWAFRP